MVSGIVFLAIGGVILTFCASGRTVEVNIIYVIIACPFIIAGVSRLSSDFKMKDRIRYCSYENAEKRFRNNPFAEYLRSEISKIEKPLPVIIRSDSVQIGWRKIFFTNYGWQRLDDNGMRTLTFFLGYSLPQDIVWNIARNKKTDVTDGGFYTSSDGNLGYSPGHTSEWNDGYKIDFLEFKGLIWSQEACRWINKNEPLKKW